MLDMNRIIIALTTLPLLALVVFCYFQPVYPAVLCPVCFGFSERPNNLYVPSGTGVEQEKKITEDYRQARIKLEAVYGSLVSEPRILAFTDENKYRSLGGSGEKGQVFGSTAVKLSPRGLNAETITWQMSRIELKTRVGPLRAYRELPAWFDEGLGILISGDPAYTSEPAADDMNENEVLKLKTPGNWSNAVEKGQKPQSAAYRLVRKWYDKAGSKGVLELIKRLRKGESFASVYTELGDRP